MTNSVVLLEFNELSPSLMSRFIADGKLPNFKRFFAESAVFLTEAAERAPYLDPWIQWITVHTGVNYRDHGTERLNEGHNVRQKRIWDYVSENGGRVWVCGSMNINYRQPINGAILPDPWTTHVAPFPAELTPYFRFIQKNVLEYTNERVPLTRADYAAFMKFMTLHGLSARTVAATVRQLTSETRGKDRWKRAVILDKLQFDVFKWYYKKLNPQFSTFFLNSTAHYQHFYWRNMEPELFEIQPSREEVERYHSAILFGYQEMDALVGRFVDLAGDRATLVFCTALSQQPFLRYEHSGGKSFYRPSNFDALMKFAGVREPFKIAPVMAHQFHVYCETEEAAKDAERRLRGLRVNGREAVSVDRSGAQIFCGCEIYEKLPNTAQLESTEAGRVAGFFEIFYQVEGMKSGMHHPDGMLWIRRPDRRHYQHETKVPLASVAPTVLQLLDVARPAQMAEQPLFGAREAQLTGI